ncbi:hypothetical protein MMC14_006736 [Varicellaria rhodocarpa]|nr:hypothetical protein [Varicellaria rhodocarpa]
MDNLWQRRSNPNNSKDSFKTDSPRTFSSAKRFGDTSSHGKSNPFNTISPSTTTTSVASPTAGASSAFGLGTGAFASFGSSAKTPKSPGTALDFGSNSVDKREKDSGKDNGERVKTQASSSSLASRSSNTAPEHPLKSTWVVWYRPPTSKYSDYEKSTIALASFATVESFWTVYTHLKRPSILPSVSDYHIFRKGIRPVWEDEENKRGGKWIVRLKKGVADRYWEDLLLAIVGDQFAEAGEEVCGAVLSVRSGEDVLSVWTRIDGGRNIKIRQVSSHILDVKSNMFQIQTLSGRVMMTVSHNGLPLIRRAKKRAMGLYLMYQKGEIPLLKSRHLTDQDHRFHEVSNE